MRAKILAMVANLTSLAQKQVNSAIELLDEGCTVPFIARYRKDNTGGLTDTDLRNIYEAYEKAQAIEARRETIIKSIASQEKLTPSLATKIQNAQSLVELEDLYLPYKPKRRTKGQIAIERGLKPLAQMLFEDLNKDPIASAKVFIDPKKEINNEKEALDGAKAILMEQIASIPELVGSLRDKLWSEGNLISAVAPNKQTEKTFSDYFEFQEQISKIPSHRMLALLRGQREGVLRLSIELPASSEETSIEEGIILSHLKFENLGRVGEDWFREVVRWTYKVKLKMQLETELLSTARTAADETAITVFANNAHDLLMRAPLTAQTVMGIDPGFRTGVKIAIVSDTAKVLATETLYPHPPQKHAHSRNALLELITKYKVGSISIGNGTASRETFSWVQDALKDLSAKPKVWIISEAGASVYSASEYAANELPSLDVSLRGAVSIARRLQDPLSELVKIEPKAIGVGQYQHDVNQRRLAERLAAVVEDCVNNVGVDANTASSALLKHVSGLNENLAKKIVTYRDAHGPFKSRDNLKQVSGLGEKTFEQAAGFMRIVDGEESLDKTIIHPEHYDTVRQMATEAKAAVADLFGNKALIAQITPAKYSAKIGEHTVKDILEAMAKPTFDPRADFAAIEYKPTVEKISDLKDGMSLSGVVTNVADFGAFIDIGVHQDGLVHISELADKFVKDPRSVVKVGQIVSVKVLSVDKERKRISLTMRQGSTAKAEPIAAKPQRKVRQDKPSTAPMSSFGDALRAAMNDG